MPSAHYLRQRATHFPRKMPLLTLVAPLVAVRLAEEADCPRSFTTGRGSWNRICSFPSGAAGPTDYLRKQATVFHGRYPYHLCLRACAREIAYKASCPELLTTRGSIGDSDHYHPVLFALRGRLR